MRNVRDLQCICALDCLLSALYSTGAIGWSVISVILYVNTHLLFCSSFGMW